MPQRRCAGCGRAAPKPELVRFALVREPGARRGRAVLDATGTMPGRGAYVCRTARTGAPADACLQRAVRRGGLSRTLRCAVTVEASRELVESTGG